MSLRLFSRACSAAPTLRPLTGKVALVTGAGSGVGRASALALASAGASLALTGRREAQLTETAGRIAEAGGAPALVLPADLRDPSSVASLFDAIEAEHSRLDVLFNNAGAGAP
eukprot:5708008-Prymnesium_polylepis.1